MCCNLQNVILANVKHVCDVQIKPDSVTMSSKCDSAVRNDKTLHFHLEFFITLPNARSSLSHVNERGNSTNSSYAKASVLNLGHYGFRGGASLQIENAQLKLHFSTCMLVLSFE